MATSDFDVELFERRLQSLKDSQESIQGLSAWCLERRQHHKKIVATWLQVLKKVKVEHRLTLFYLANDVIQYSKRKNFEFVESWGTTLQRATTMVRDEKVKHRILRIFKIWDQRQVYDEEFLADLSGLISAAPKKKSEPQAIGSSDEFQAALLISTMRSCATLEQATDARLRDLRESNIDIDNAEELCASLKDRRHVEDAEKEVDTAVRNVENYVRALEAEIRERSQILELLEQADQFYETQRGEVKIVTNAYRNFGSRVKNLKKKLDELLPTLVSPIPSPDVNAPSPSPDSDIELPGDDSQTANQSTIIDVAPPSMYGSYRHDYEPLPVPAPELSHGNVPGDFTNNFSSFIGGNMDFDMRNIFNDRSATPTGTNQYNDSLEAKPIEVINMRPSKTESSNNEFNISNFLKAVLPSSDGTSNTGGIPGLGLDLPDPAVESPQRPDYRHSPAIGQLPVTSAIVRMINSQGALLGNLNNCQMSHSTPLPVRNLAGDSHTPSPYSSQNSQSNVTLPFDGSVNSVNPLPPPPMPPPIFLDDENCYNKLPPKFPTWTPASEASKEPAKWEEKGKNSMNPTWPGEDDDKGKAQWGDSGNERWESGSDSAWSSGVRGKNEIMSETPESPPMYEKSGFSDPVEYNDSQTQEPLLSSSGDVDHRVIPIPMTVETQLPHRLIKAADVDHRNLISLTGSPANHSNINDPSLTVLANNNSLWSATDQDYRQQMQSGDIVESVDMEMSDDETDSKQKGRVLVDVRSQDRDMRGLLSQPSHHLDMDMRMIPLPTGQMPTRGQMIQDMHGIHSGQSQFHLGQSDFHQGQPDFRHNVLEFRPNQSNFHSNQPQQNFLQNQQEFHPGQQDFHQSQHDFRQDQQDFEFHENQHGRRANQEFHGESQLRGRYVPSTDQHHRDSLGFHRNERGGGRGRGFVRNRRDRYSEDHNNQQRNVAANNNRRQMSQEQHQNVSPEILPNNRPLLLQPPDTVVILDDDGMPIGMPESSDQQPPNVEDLDQEAARSESGCVPEDRLTSSLVLEHRIQEEAACHRDGVQNQPCGFPIELETVPDQEVPPVATLESQQQRGGPNQQVPVVVMTTDRDVTPNPRCELVADIPSNVPDDRDVVTKSIQDDQLVEPNLQRLDDGIAETLVHEVAIPQRQLSEQLKALMNSSKLMSDDLKRQSANGSFDELQDDGSTSKKRILLSNGPQMIGTSGIGPNGPVIHGGSGDLHPIVVYEYDNPNSAPNFRPRGAGPSGSFPPWRGGLPRGRGGFRGGPRAPWIDRGPRGPPTGNFLPRGLKRGGQFRGGGFRGRGRGSNW